MEVDEATKVVSCLQRFVVVVVLGPMLSCLD